jgi:hypothetical protein
VNLISYNQIHLIKDIPHFTTTQLYNITDFIIGLLKYWNPRFTIFEDKIRTFKTDSDNFRVIRISPNLKYHIRYLYLYALGWEDKILNLVM